MNINAIVENNKWGLGVSGLGCLIFFVASFFGHNYIWEDNIVLSLVFSFLSTIALFFLSLFLIKFKNDPTRKSITIPEIILLTCYIIIAIISSLFVIHFVNTEFAFKEDIKKMGLSKLDTLSDMREKYIEQTESITLGHQTECKRLVTEYLGERNDKKKIIKRDSLKEKFDFSFGVVEDKDKFFNKCKTFKETQDDSYKKPIPKLKSSNKTEMDNIRKTFKSYTRRKITEALKLADDWILSDFNSLSAKFPDFKYDLPLNNDALQLNDLGKSLRHEKAKNGVALGFLLLIHLMILGWYLFRGGKKLGGFLDEKDYYK